MPELSVHKVLVTDNFFRPAWYDSTQILNSCPDLSSSSVKSEINNNDDPEYSDHQQPYKVCHLEESAGSQQLQLKRNGHLGYFPLCRASASQSMDLLREVLQPQFNKEVKEILEKYIPVFRQGARNAVENHKREPYKSAVKLDVDEMVLSACREALESSKSLFSSGVVVCY